jgi:hypothetical protein
MKSGQARTKRPERRTNTRAKIRKVGRIVDGADKVSPCIILDLSDTGALLLVHTKIPDKFQLYYSAKRTLRDAVVVRRQQDTIGVHFASPPVVIAPGDARIARWTA